MAAQSVATLLWNYVDVKTREFLIDKRDEDGGREGHRDGDRRKRRGAGEQDRRRALEHLKLKRMVAYADGTGCLAHDDPSLLRRSRCRRGLPVLRQLPQARGAHQRSAVARQKDSFRRGAGGERWGRRKIAAMLTGKTEELPDALVSLSTTGLLSEHDPKLTENGSTHWSVPVR